MFQDLGPDHLKVNKEISEVVVHMGTTTSPSFIKIGIKTKKSFIKSTFFEFLIHLYLLIHF